MGPAVPPWEVSHESRGFFVGCECDLDNRPCLREFWGHDGEAQIVANKYGKRKLPEFDKASHPHSALVVVEDGDYVINVKRGLLDEVLISIYKVDDINYMEQAPFEIELKLVVSVQAGSAPTETHWEEITDQIGWQFAEKTGARIGKAVMFALRRAFGDEHYAPQEGA